MSSSVSLKHRSAGHNGAFLLATLAVMAGMFCAVFAGPVQKANAEEAASGFCPTNGYMLLDPAWTGIYRCDAPDNVSGYNRTWSIIFTQERAGCVDYADVWHNLIDSWKCFPKYTQGSISIRQDGGWYRGVIRNNNTNNSGWFHGIVSWKQ